MKNNLEFNIQKHLTLLEASLVSTERLLKAARERDVDAADFESQNRERIIGALETIQTDIENEINTLELNSVSKELIQILKSWTEDLNESFEKTLALDKEISSLLNDEKDKTTQEIATIYKARTSHQGYNLNNLKK
jgi:hypothetical protein